ncbi:MAG: hypothetical protein WD118_10695 [Phycisphaeraceae bacterium]
MKIIPPLACNACLLLALGSGCQSSAHETGGIHHTERSESNAWLVSSYQQQQMQAAVVRQRTIYPHHFHDRTAELNELGQRDLAILARHFDRWPGELNVRQSEADDPLYEARLVTVRQALEDEGVDLDAMTLADGEPGGDGVASHDAKDHRADAPGPADRESRDSSRIIATPITRETP